MAKRTLDSIWTNIEKIHQQINDPKKKTSDGVAAFRELLAKSEVQSIVNDLGGMLMGDHEGFDEVQTVFSIAPEVSDKFLRPSWFDSKKRVLHIDPLRVMDFARECQAIAKDPMKLGMGGGFPAYRLRAFMGQLAKLPSKALLFVQIYQELAVSSGLTHIGLSENTMGQLDDTTCYQTLLWAFNQLEKKMYQLHGIHIRTEFTLIWHEANWSEQT